MIASALIAQLVRAAVLSTAGPEFKSQWEHFFAEYIIWEYVKSIVLREHAFRLRSVVKIPAHHHQNLLLFLLPGLA